MTTISSSFVGTEAFSRLLQRPKDALAQHILIQRDLIREFKVTHQSSTDETVDYLKNELSYANAKIIELEDDLTEARDTISQMVEGNSTGWDT
jgi:hypothetical protein